MLAPTKILRFAFGLVTGFFLILTARADERLKDIACRSVHLSFPAEDGSAFYNEVTVDKSDPGTFFMTCGFDMGYFGLQELGNGKKLVIFSVWEPGKQDDPKTVDEDKRVKLIEKGDKVRVGRFGNEGTGGQSFLDLDWKVGQPYRFLVTAKPEGARTVYSGFVFSPESSRWLLVARFSTLTGGKPLRGYYSFLEDFRRNRVSATKVREAHFGNGWVKARNGSWVPLTRAKFTADANPVTNIDASVDGPKFRLATGGETKNVGTPLLGRMERGTGNSSPPSDLPDIP